MSSYTKKTTCIVKLPFINLNTPEQYQGRGDPKYTVTMDFNTSSSEDTEKWLKDFTKELESSVKEFLKDPETRKELKVRRIPVKDVASVLPVVQKTMDDPDHIPTEEDPYAPRVPMEGAYRMYARTKAIMVTLEGKETPNQPKAFSALRERIDLETTEIYGGATGKVYFGYRPFLTVDKGEATVKFNVVLYSVQVLKNGEPGEDACPFAEEVPGEEESYGDF